VPSDLLEVAGWREKQFSGKPLDFVMLQQLQEKCFIV
jgi:hypothetical protein